MEGAEGRQDGREGEGEEGGREKVGDGQSCRFWSIQVSVLFDEDKVKC